MGLFEQFPYSNFHEINLDWVIEQIKRIGDMGVLSVNGQTGEVILYQSENVVFPDVDSGTWRMVRTAGGQTAGIMFQNGLAYIMAGGNAERVYTVDHPPVYPVTSVNNQTGDITLYQESAIRLPDVTDSYTNVRRYIKTGGVDNLVGMEFQNHKVYLIDDNNRYQIYDQNNQPPYPVNSVNGKTGAVMIAIPFTEESIDDPEWVGATASPNHNWLMTRSTVDGDATIRLFTDTAHAEGYIEFWNEQTQTTYSKKILTVDDIPSSSGVVSINGMNGVVTLYGDSIPIAPGSPYSIEDITTDLDGRLSAVETTDAEHGTDIDKIKADIAIVENGNTATHNITAGQYVLWKTNLYTASTNISNGTALSGTNLSAVSNGGLNALNSNIKSVKSLWVNPNTNLSFAAQQVSLNEAVTNYQFVYIEFRSKTTSSAYTSIFVPSIALNAMLIGYSFYGGSVTSRTVKAVNNGTVMEFADAANTNVDNTLVIPSRIIGYIKI